MVFSQPVTSIFGQSALEYTITVCGHGILRVHLPHWTCASCAPNWYSTISFVRFGIVASTLNVDGQPQVLPMRIQSLAIQRIAKCALRCLPCFSFINFELSTEHTSKFGRDNWILFVCTVFYMKLHLFAHTHFLGYCFVCSVWHLPKKSIFIKFSTHYMRQIQWIYWNTTTEYARALTFDGQRI